ncbi:MAG: hypothetical protein HY247_03365 [archaeon]|nr:MAG: hypothetical protein HY247_03365 [archaeon]
MQQKAGASSTSSTPTCAYTINPVQNNLLVVSFSYYPTSVTVTSVTDTLGNSFAQDKTATTSGATTNFVGYIYSAQQTHASGADTITITLSSAPTVAWFTCLEFSGASDVLRTSSSGTGTVTSGTISSSVTSFTPSSGDLVYVYSAYQTCGSSQSITPSASYTAGTAKGTDFSTGSTCRNATVRNQNEYDEYSANTALGSNTAALSIGSQTNDNTGTRGWLELAVVYKFQVTQPSACTMDNSAAQVTLALSGGSPTPKTLLCDGASHNILLAPSTSLTATEPSDATNTRDRFSGGATTASVTSCTTGTCSPSWSFTNYAQLRNSYSSTSNAQSTFDSGLGSITVQGTVAGSAGTSLGSMTITGGSSSSTLSNVWSDYNRAVSNFPSTLSGAPANSQWLRSGTCSFSDTTGGNTDVCNYYKQWTNTFSLSATAQSTFDSGLSSVAISGTSLGSSATVCTVTPTSGHSSDTCSGYVDNSNAPSVSTTISTPPANSQWKCSTCNFGSITSGGTTKTVSYYKQWSTTWSAAANAQSTFDSGLSSLTVTGTSLGTSANICSIVPISGHSSDTCSGYIDNSQSGSFPGTIGGSPANSRWACSTCSTSAVSSGGTTVAVNYYKQWTETWQATAKAQSTLDNGLSSLVKGRVFGSAGATICTLSTSGTPATTSCTGYIDNAQSATFDSTMAGAPSNSQWICGSCTTSSQTSGNNLVNVNYYKQWSNSFQLTARAQTSFDSGLSAFSFTGTSLGVSSATVCTAAVTSGQSTASCSGYSDTGQPASIAATIGGSPSNSRWINSAGGSSSTSSISAGGSTYNTDFYKQYSNTFQATARAQTTFDSGLSTLITGNQLGSTSTVCAISPSGGQATGSCSAYTDASGSIAFSATMSGAGSDVRWVCASCPTPSVTSGGSTVNGDYYKQLSNTYQVSARAQASFDTGMSWAVTGVSLGASGTVCTVASAASSSASCTGYSDYNTGVSVAQAASGAPSGSRWQSSVACSFTQTSGGNTNNCDSYKQWSTTWTASAAALAYFDKTDMSATVTGSSFGSTTSLCSISTVSGDASDGCSAYVDHAGAGSFSIVLSSPPSDERWMCSPCTTDSVTSSGSQSVSYYAQLSQTFEATPGAQPLFDPGLGPLLVSGMYLGAGSTLCSIAVVSGSTSASCQAYADYGSIPSSPQTIAGASSNARWACGAAGTCSYAQVTSAGATSSLVYFHQYSQTFSYSVSDGGSPGAPDASGLRFGSSYSQSVTGSPTSTWFDASGSISVTNPLQGSGSTERWEADLPAVPASSSATYSFEFFHQYVLQTSYSTSDSSTPTTAPSLSYTSMGAGVSRSLSAGSMETWLDSGTDWTVSSPITAPSLTERWSSAQTLSGTSSGYSTLAVAFTHQYALSISVPALVGISHLGAVSGGSSCSTSGSTETCWVQAGGSAGIEVDSVVTSGATRYVFSSWSGASTSSSPSTTVLVDSAKSASASFTTQFKVMLRQSGSAEQPVVDYSAGSPSSGQTPISFWADQGSTLTFAFPLTVQGTTGVRYALTSTDRSSGLSVTSATNVSASYRTQYYLNVTTSFSEASGGGWFDSGSSSTFGTAATIEYPSSGTRHLLEGWEGSGTGSYTGTDLSHQVTLSGPISQSATWSTQYLVAYAATGCAVDLSVPQSEWVYSGDNSTLLFTSTSDDGAGTRCTFVADDRPSPVEAPITVNGTYDTSFFLTVSSDHGSPSGEGWYESGSAADFGATSPEYQSSTTRYSLVVWTSFSEGGFNGTSLSSSLEMTGPISESAAWVQQNYVTYSTTGCPFPVSTPGPEWVDENSSATGGFPTSAANGAGVTCRFIGDDRPSLVSQPTNVTATYATEGCVSTCFLVEYQAAGCAFSASLPESEWVQSGDAPTGTYPTAVSNGQGGRCAFSADDRPSEVTENATVTATYRQQYYLGITTSHGSAVGNGWYDSGSRASFALQTSIVVTGSGTRYLFLGWTSYSAGGYNGSLASGAATLGGPVQQTALWSKQFLLTVRSDPSWVTSRPLLQGSPGWYNAGSTLSLTAKRGPFVSPTSDRAYFTSWTSNGWNSTSRFVSVTLSGPVTLTAHYSIPQTIRFSLSGPTRLAPGQVGSYAASYSFAARTVLDQVHVRGSVMKASAGSNFRISCDGTTVWSGDALPKMRMTVSACGGSLTFSRSWFDLSLGHVDSGASHTISLSFDWSFSSTGTFRLLGGVTASSASYFGKTSTAATSPLVVRVALS